MDKNLLAVTENLLVLERKKRDLMVEIDKLELRKAELKREIAQLETRPMETPPNKIEEGVDEEYFPSMILDSDSLAKQKLEFKKRTFQTRFEKMESQTFLVFEDQAGVQAIRTTTVMNETRNQNHNGDVTKEENKSVYHLAVTVDGLPIIIDPRDTIASRCFSERTCTMLWMVYTNHVSALALTTANISGVLCSLLSLMGLYPSLGYYSALMLPLAIFVCWHTNVTKCLVLLRSFSFWSVVTLLVVAFSGIADAVAVDEENPARLFAAIISLVVSFSVIFFEAHVPKKRKSYLMAIGYSIFAMTYYAVIITWSVGCWTNIRQTVYQVGTVAIDVQSISMSAMGTVAVLVAKCAWTTFRSPEANPGVIMNADISYRLLISNREPDDKV